MRYRVLGDLKVVGTDGSLLSVAPRPRVLLATLLLEASQVVALDRLVDAVWDEAPPSTARSQIQICVSALRRSLAAAGIADAIVTRAPGYLIQVPPGELDLQVFDELVVAGRAAAGQGRLADAANRFGRALAVWRGAPFGGMTSRLLRAARAGLAERHLALVEENVEVRLRLGDHTDLVGELRRLVAAHPTRERLRGQLMTALYQDGRQAEALAEYRQARQTFVAELGVEPGPSLQRVERAILAGDAGLGRPAVGTAGRVPGQVRRTATPPRILPAGVADFVGRDTEAAQLCRVLAQRPRPAQVPVAVVSGMAGVGKTTLAVHVAHQCAADFPDGQLFVTLRGTGAHPVRPARALGRFLRLLGVPEQAVPDGLEERAELYRDRLAGRRLLVVLDDAAGEEQVVPLLPGGSPSAVLVTSRRRLPRLPAGYRSELAVFGPRPATELLALVAGAARVAAEPAAVGELIRLCDGLPLALRIAAARLADRPHWTVARLVARLADDRHRLDELTHGGLGVRQRVAPAYHGLADPAARLFRRLGLLEAADFDAWVSMPLLGAGPHEAEDALEALVDARLLEVARVDGHIVRYRFHDLIRMYARERLAAEEPAEVRRGALVRLMDEWYDLAVTSRTGDH